MNNLLTLLENRGIRPRRVSGAFGGEYASHCPSCGDDGKGSGSDRFHIWPQRETGGRGSGRYWCRKCGITGDTIQFLMDVDRIGFREACTELGIPLPDNDTMPTRAATPALPRMHDHQPREYQLPSDTWTAAAASFLDDCRKRLDERQDAISWLADRGIDIETARRYGLGYNESSRGGDRYRPRSRWGLPAATNDEGREKKLWLPRGWVIPLFDDRGRVIQLRIRRLNDDIDRFASDIKYLMIAGSCPATMVLHPEADAHAVVESGLDTILLAGLFGGRLGAVTTWNAQARPDRMADEILQRSDCVLDCLDFDDAGSEQQLWWAKRYRRHKRWPVPQGKDPGDAHKAGVDLRAWILAGLPPGLAMRIGAAAAPTAVGGTGTQEETAPIGAEPEAALAAHDTIQEPQAEYPLPGDDGQKIENNRQRQVPRTNDRAGDLGQKIEALPSIMRAEVESFRDLMEAHPLGAWLSGDGRSAGPVCGNADWKRANWEVYGRFTKLFYGPAHGIICDLWEPEFKRTGRALRKS